MLRVVSAGKQLLTYFAMSMRYTGHNQRPKNRILTEFFGDVGV